MIYTTVMIGFHAYSVLTLCPPAKYLLPLMVKKQDQETNVISFTFEVSMARLSYIILYVTKPNVDNTKSAKIKGKTKTKEKLYSMCMEHLQISKCAGYHHYLLA